MLRMVLLIVVGLLSIPAVAQEPAASKWKYRAEVLRPFWISDTMEGESVLFLRDEGTGVALADLTATWSGFLEQKRDWDQTGNGVNHPKDFGHRVYAQVITSLLIDYRDGKAR